MSRDPLLNQDDFAALLYGGSRAFLARRHGMPPTGDASEGMGNPRWRDLPFGDGFRDFEQEALRFFGLETAPVFDLSETPSESGSVLFPLWRDSQRIVVFHTSGSTGAAQPHPHPEPFLCQEATAVSALFDGVRRVVCTAPPFHSYGFIFGFLMPKLMGLPRLELPALPTFLLGRLEPGDLLVSFPLFLKKITTPPPASVRCLTSTAPCPPELFDDLRRLEFSGVTEIYGSSETGAIAYRESGDAPFALLNYWSRAGADHLRRALPDGSGSREYFLPDNVEWLDDRALRPSGRRDKAVQVAGVNVYSERVARVIGANPLVAECAVRPMRPDEGERLKAYVVLREGVDETGARAALGTHLRKSLSTAERPGSIVFGPALPRTIAGKLADWEIKARHELA